MSRCSVRWLTNRWESHQNARWLSSLSSLVIITVIKVQDDGRPFGHSYCTVLWQDLRGGFGLNHLAGSRSGSPIFFLPPPLDPDTKLTTRTIVGDRFRLTEGKNSRMYCKNCCLNRFEWEFGSEFKITKFSGKLRFDQQYEKTWFFSTQAQSTSFLL